MKSKTTARASSRPPAAPTREQVQALAHALWMDRGCPHGQDVEIWLEAERQLGGTTSPGATKREDFDPEDAGRVDEELERRVSPPEQRSPTAL